MEKWDRREQILASAVAVFAERGYHDAAISDIIDRAGIARGTFYLYFTSKRAIFDDILERSFGQILAQIQPVDISEPVDPERVRAQLAENARRLAHLVATERDLFRVLLAEAAGLEEPVRGKLTLFYERLASWVADSLAKGIKRGFVRPCNAALAAHGLIGICRGIFWAWVSGMLPLDEEAFVHEAVELCQSGLLLTRPTASKSRVKASARRRQ